MIMILASILKCAIQITLVGTICCYYTSEDSGTLRHGNDSDDNFQFTGTQIYMISNILKLVQICLK